MPVLRPRRLAVILVCLTCCLATLFPAAAADVVHMPGARRAYAAKFLSADGGSMSAEQAEALQAQRDAEAGVVDPEGVVGQDAADMPDGTYYGSAEGFKSAITVAVTVKGGAITEVKVVSEDDDAAYFKFGSKVIARIVDKQRVDIDGVTGATYSSEGIRDAVAAAVSGDAGQRAAGMVMMCLGYVNAVLALAALAAVVFTSVRRARATAPRPRRDWAQWQRLSIQGLFFALAPSVFATAFSGIKNVMQQVYGYETVEWSLFLTVLFALLAFTVLFGRFFCGYACAFGLLGDVVYRAVGFCFEKAGIARRPSLPAGAMCALRWLKYVVLAGLLLAVLVGAGPWINENSPWTSFSRLSSLSVRGLTVASAAMLVAIIVGMAVQERFFCRFLCPLGAIFSLVPVLPFERVRRNRPTCLKGCSSCRRSCPVDVEPKGGLLAGECVACGRCAEMCPAGNVVMGVAGDPDGQGRRHERVPRWASSLVRAVLLLALLWLLGLVRYLPDPSLFG